MLTACGIETLNEILPVLTGIVLMLQQCLPLAVLKRRIYRLLCQTCTLVATVLTACGIETPTISRTREDLLTVATVLTACGIETAKRWSIGHDLHHVATVLTACGIETELVQKMLLTRSLVATVLTACGIETYYIQCKS